MGDAELVALAVGGDRDAFAALYDRHAQAVHDFLRRMLGDPHDAADALQDTFLAAGSRLHQLRDPTKVRAWLYAIARRHAYRATAARRRTEPLEDDDVTSVDLDPTDAIAESELNALVDAAAEGLDERDRAVLELHFRHGLGGDELANALGIERGNAHVLVHRVKERLQTSIGALVVARHGRASCPDLANLLGAWDGKLSTVVRKRIARHADGCATCEATMANGMRPAALLGAVPLVPLPAGARELVLERVELCSHTGEPWPGDDGFPPGDERPVDPDGDGEGRRRASRTLLGALAALVVVLLAGSVVLADADPVDRGQAPAGAADDDDETTTSERGRQTTTSSTVVGGTSTSVTVVDPSTPTTPTTRRPTTPTTRRPGTTPTTADPGTTPPPTAEPTTTTAPETTTTTRPRPTTTLPPTTTTTRPRPTTTLPPTTTTEPQVIG